MLTACETDLGTMIQFLGTFGDQKFQGAMVRKVVSMESSHFLKSEAPWRFAIHLRLGILMRRRHEIRNLTLFATRKGRLEGRQAKHDPPHYTLKGMFLCLFVEEPTPFYDLPLVSIPTS